MAVENKIKEMKVLGGDSPEAANHVQAMETILASMKNSWRYFNEGTRGLSRSEDDSGNASGNNTRGCFNWFIENFSMILGCFGTRRQVRNYNAGENITSPLIKNRMTGSIEMVVNVEGLEKKSFLEWLNHHELGRSHEEWESELTRLKDEAIQLGIRLCHLLLDFIFLASERGDNMEIFEVFRGSRIHEDYENFVVLRRVFKLLETIETEVRNLKNKGKGSLKEKISMNLIIQRKHFSRDLANTFCRQILSLHMLVSKELWEKSALSKTMKEGFGEVEAELSEIKQEISKLRVLVLSSGEQDSETVEFLKSQLELKVREMWSGFGLNQREE